MSVLVTGATSGFGVPIARRFAQAGHPIVAAGRRTDRLQALVSELGRDRVHPLELDVRDRHINAIELMPVAQAFGPLAVHRETKAAP